MLSHFGKPLDSTPYLIKQRWVGARFSHRLTRVAYPFGTTSVVQPHTRINFVNTMP
jgi:hypothetical protein